MEPLFTVVFLCDIYMLYMLPGPVDVLVDSLSLSENKKSDKCVQTHVLFGHLLKISPQDARSDINDYERTRDYTSYCVRKMLLFLLLRYMTELIHR